jgi:hypothetical protein
VFTLKAFLSSITTAKIVSSMREGITHS